jgi:rare lipoprotein A
MRPMNPLRGTLVVTGALSIAAVAPAMAQTPAPPTAASGSTTTITGPTAPTAPAKAHGALSIASVRRNVTLGNRELVSGRLRPARAGRRVQLQVRQSGAWRTVARDTTDQAGRWRLRYRPARPASLRTRVAFAGDGATTPAARSVGRVNVFRRALVSWYGPGLYGGHLACGGTLSTSTLGVANKHLPCGTLVTLRHRGRSVRVPVVDRGPYVGAREFDLTSATRSRLGFSGTGTVLTTR